MSPMFHVASKTPKSDFHFQNKPCRVIYFLILMSPVFMSHFNFRKCPCHRVQFKCQGPKHYLHCCCLQAIDTLRKTKGTVTLVAETPSGSDTSSDSKAMDTSESSSSKPEVQETVTAAAAVTTMAAAKPDAKPSPKPTGK